jgi:hypothetical protein
MTIFIVVLPINSMVIFHSYQMLPLCKAMRQLVGGMRAEPVERTLKVRYLTETWEMEQAQTAAPEQRGTMVLYGTDLNWLVVWNILFPYIGNNNPNWLSYFSEG